MSDRLNNISANAGRLYAALAGRSPAEVAVDTRGTAEACVVAATLIEDAVEAQERARYGLTTEARR